jgi:predicted outer membrane repeat protein
MRNLITCLSVCVLSGATFAETWTVDDDGKADFDNIQAAVDAASDGDEILVMPGTYTGTGGYVVDMGYKNLVLRSVMGAEKTTVDGEMLRAGVRFSYDVENAETNNAIDGFSIQNCVAFEDPFWGTTNRGGAIFIADQLEEIVAIAQISNCVMRNNSATGNWSQGGAVYIGLFNNCTITNCQFLYNTCLNGMGGAIRGYHETNSTISNCTFTENSAQYGGAMSFDSADMEITNCVVTNNSATDIGGGLYCRYASPYISDTSICGNSPDQIYLDSSIIHDEGGNTIADSCEYTAGACCSNDICVDGEEELCNTYGGQWLGVGTLCSENPCPNSCLGDITGDGVVDVSDLLVVIGVWGTCP